MKRRFFGLIASILILVLCCACAGQSEEPTQEYTGEKITLTIYAQYSDDDTRVPYDYAVEQLKKKYPQVEMKLIIQSSDDGATLSSFAEIGQLPDIFQSNSVVISKLREEGLIYQLDKVAQRTGFLDKLMSSNKELMYNEEDGHIYVFPYAGQEYALIYYNKALFAKYHLEVPKTFDDMMHCIEVFRANDIVPLELMSEGWVYTSMYDIIATRYRTNGIVDLDSGVSVISSASYRMAAEQLEKMVSAGIFQDDVGLTDYDTACEAFFSGKAAMFLNGQWFITDAQNALGNDVDWMYYPSYDLESYESKKYAFSGGGSPSGFSVNAKSPYADIAAEVAEFFAEKYCEAKVLYRGTPLVALDTGLEPVNGFPAMMQKLSETLPRVQSSTQFAWGLKNPKFYTAMTRYSIGLVTGEYTADQFIRKISDEMKR